MNKVIAACVLAIGLLTFGLMFKSVIFGDGKPVACHSSDYNCNFDRYIHDISKKPPDFSRAETVAIASPAAIHSNVSKVLSLPDYQAASMLRVLLAYPDSVQRRLCASNAITQMRSRQSRISSPFEQQEFSRLLGELDCSTS